MQRNPAVEDQCKRPRVQVLYVDAVTDCCCQDRAALQERTSL
jgi:hypothetical protein